MINPLFALSFLHALSLTPHSSTPIKICSDLVDNNVWSVETKFCAEVSYPNSPSLNSKIIRLMNPRFEVPEVKKWTNISEIYLAASKRNAKNICNALSNKSTNQDFSFKKYKSERAPESIAITGKPNELNFKETFLSEIDCNTSDSLSPKEITSLPSEWSPAMASGGEVLIPAWGTELDCHIRNINDEKGNNITASLIHMNERSSPVWLMIEDHQDYDEFTPKDYIMLKGKTAYTFVIEVNTKQNNKYTLDCTPSQTNL